MPKLESDLLQSLERVGEEEEGVGGGAMPGGFH